MNLDIARALYFRELDAKTQSDSRVGIFSALLSALGGALFFLVTRSWPPSSAFAIAGLVVSLAGAIVFVFAVIWLLRSFIGFEYVYLPPADDLLQHWQKLSAHFAAHPDSGSARDDFDAELITRLSSAATRNAMANRVRSARLHSSAQLMLVVVLLSATSGLCLALDAFSSKYRHNGGHNMSDDPKPAQPPPTPPTPPAAKPTPPPKPVMPQNVIWKGGAERPKAPPPPKK